MRSENGYSEEEIMSAWRNAKAMRYRNFGVPAYIAAARPNSSGELIEMIGGEQDTGEILIFHAMQLTKKMASELNL